MSEIFLKKFQNITINYFVQNSEKIENFQKKLEEFQKNIIPKHKPEIPMNISKIPREFLHLFFAPYFTDSFLTHSGRRIKNFSCLVIVVPKRLLGVKFCPILKYLGKSENIGFIM